MVKCLVKDCNSTYRKNCQAKVEDRVKLFRFPRDDRLKAQWLRLCGVHPKKVSTSKMVICSLHFEKQAFTLKSRLGFTGIRHRQLEPTALPTLNLPDPIETELDNDIGKIGHSAENDNKSDFTETRQVESDNASKENESNILNKVINNSFGEDTITISTGEETCKLIALLQRRNKLLEKELVAAQEKTEGLLLENKKKDETIKNLDNKLRLVYKNFSNLSSNSYAIHHQVVRNTLLKIFSESQVRMLLDKVTRVQWSVKDIELAITLRNISPRAYEHIRVKMGYPLPCLSTIRRWEAQRSKILKNKRAKAENDCKNELITEDIELPDNQIVPSVLDAITDEDSSKQLEENKNILTSKKKYTPQQSFIEQSLKFDTQNLVETSLKQNINNFNNSNTITLFVQNDGQLLQLNSSNNLYQVLPIRNQPVLYLAAQNANNVNGLSNNENTCILSDHPYCLPSEFNGQSFKIKSEFPHECNQKDSTLEEINKIIQNAEPQNFAEEELITIEQCQ